jgi:heme o synthase
MKRPASCSGRTHARPGAGGDPLIRDYVELTKPRITWLILMSTAIGYFFGAHGGWDWLALLHTIIGTGLIASGTAALNQWYERDADALMNRTRNRPIPAGRLAPGNAMWFAVALSVLGFVELWFGANPLTAILGALTLLVYLFVYTPLKQKSWHATTIGAVPGAMPPLIGFAGAAGQLTAEAWILFAILFLWQFPHFYAIAWMYRDDYSRGGIKMLPVVEPDGDSTIRQILAYSLLLIPISMLPRWFGMTGNIYLAGALVLGFAYFYAGVLASRERTRVRARGVLLASVVYLPILYGLMMADRPHL